MRLRPASWMVSKVMRNRLGCAVRSFLGTWPSKHGLLIVLCHAQDAAIFFKEEGKHNNASWNERENENEKKHGLPFFFHEYHSTSAPEHKYGATLMHSRTRLSLLSGWPALWAKTLHEWRHGKATADSIQFLSPAICHRDARIATNHDLQRPGASETTQAARHTGAHQGSEIRPKYVLSKTSATRMAWRAALLLCSPTLRLRCSIRTLYDACLIEGVFALRLPKFKEQSDNCGERPASSISRCHGDQTRSPSIVQQQLHHGWWPLYAARCNGVSLSSV